MPVMCCRFCGANLYRVAKRHLRRCHLVNSHIHKVHDYKTVALFLDSIGIKNKDKTAYNMVHDIARRNGIYIKQKKYTYKKKKKRNHCNLCEIICNERYCSDCILRLRQEKANKEGDRETYYKIFRYRWRFLLSGV